MWFHEYVREKKRAVLLVGCHVQRSIQIENSREVVFLAGVVESSTRGHTIAIVENDGIFVVNYC